MDTDAETSSDERRSLEITAEDGPGPMVLRLNGELDASTAPALRDEIVRLIDGSPRDLDLDLAALRFVDSVGLSVLVAGHHHAGGRGVRYRLVNVAPGCRRILEITRLDEILDVS